MNVFPLTQAEATTYLIIVILTGHLHTLGECCSLSHHFYPLNHHRNFSTGLPVPVWLNKSFLLLPEGSLQNSIWSLSCIPPNSKMKSKFQKYGPLGIWVPWSLTLVILPECALSWNHSNPSAVSSMNQVPPPSSQLVSLMLVFPISSNRFLARICLRSPHSSLRS